MSIEVVTEAQAREWCQTRRIGLDALKQPDARQFESRGITFTIPEDAGARVSLAQILYPDTWKIEGPVLIWTTGWSIWPSGEHMPLFRRLRESFGETRSLDEASAQLVNEASEDDGRSIVILHILFLWDCWMVSEACDYAIHLSHDEWGIAYATADSVRSALMRELGAMGLLQ